jgi:hypothetical protein
MKPEIQIIKDRNKLLQATIEEGLRQIAELEAVPAKKWEPTPKQICDAADKSDSYVRLQAYVDEFAPGYEFTQHELNAYVYFDFTLNKWRYLYSDDEKSITVYMPEQVAKDLVLKLNSGEVEL